MRSIYSNTLVYHSERLIRYWGFSLLIIVIIFSVLLLPTCVFARVTPEDIVNTKKEAYEKVVKNYSYQNQQKLKTLSEKIAQINKKRADQLGYIMETQAGILDEYERRANGKNVEQIKKARYWITYAHEAVAYQAAKIYVFELSNEQNLRRDVLSTISLFQNELESTRKKVIYSQKILFEVVKIK